MNALNSVAGKLGCNKIILNCSEEKQAFYRKCGYDGSGFEMVYWFKGANTPE